MGIKNGENLWAMSRAKPSQEQSDVSRRARIQVKSDELIGIEHGIDEGGDYLHDDN